MAQIAQIGLGAAQGPTRQHHRFLGIGERGFAPCQNLGGFGFLFLHRDDFGGKGGDAQHQFLMAAFHPLHEPHGFSHAAFLKTLLLIDEAQALFQGHDGTLASIEAPLDFIHS